MNFQILKVPQLGSLGSFLTWQAPDGQILQEGISEAGALCTWIVPRSPGWFSKWPSPKTEPIDEWSETRGNPKSSILMGFSIINHLFWDMPIYGNPRKMIHHIFWGHHGWIKSFLPQYDGDIWWVYSENVICKYGLGLPSGNLCSDGQFIQMISLCLPIHNGNVL